MDETAGQDKIETQPPAETANAESWAAPIEATCAQIAPDPASLAAWNRLLLLLIQAAGADRGSILMMNHDSGRLAMVAAVGLPAEAVSRGPRVRSRSISEWVFQERRGVILDGEVRNQPFEGSAALDPIQSALSIPLMAAFGAVGVLNLARLIPARCFTDEDLVLLARLAAPVAAAIERGQQAQLAHEHLHQLIAAGSGPASRLLPFGSSEISNYQLGLGYRSSRRLGSNLCDRVSHSNGTHSLIFVDVSGSGPMAAAAAAFAQGMFVAAASERRSAAGLMALLNTRFQPRSGIRPPMAAWIAQLSPAGRLTFCSGGVPAPFWIPADGSDVLRLEQAGPALGTIPDAPYDEESIRLLPADAVVVVSDEVLDSRDRGNRGFGEEHVAEMLHGLRREPLERMVGTVCEAVLSHSGRPVPLDDLVVLAIRFTPGN